MKGAGDILASGDSSGMTDNVVAQTPCYAILAPISTDEKNTTETAVAATPSPTPL